MCGKKDDRIPIGSEMSSLFINTCLNNTNPDLARLVRVTTANLRIANIRRESFKTSPRPGLGGIFSHLMENQYNMQSWWDIYYKL